MLKKRETERNFKQKLNQLTGGEHERTDVLLRVCPNERNQKWKSEEKEVNILHYWLPQNFGGGSMDLGALLSVAISKDGLAN